MVQAESAVYDNASGNFQAVEERAMLSISVDWCRDKQVAKAIDTFGRGKQNLRK
jgi:hypothetical protein